MANGMVECTNCGGSGELGYEPHALMCQTCWGTGKVSQEVAREFDEAERERNQMWKNNRKGTTNMAYESSIIDTKLIPAYTNPKRHYHNLRHIFRCLHDLELYFPTSIDKTSRKILEWAIWWHDYVYTPGAKDNEEKSARAAVDLFHTNPAFSDVAIETIKSCILATKHDRMLVVNENLEQIMCDLDLLGLADPWHMYVASSNRIRQEFSEVTEAEFNSGRIAFLRTLLERPSIFQNHDIRDRFEDAAIKNIVREIRERNQER